MPLFRYQQKDQVQHRRFEYILKLIVEVFAVQNCRDKNRYASPIYLFRE